MDNKEQKNNTSSKPRVLSGVVVSVKAKDTAVVEINRYRKHPKYGKYVRISKRYKAHDAGNTRALGEKVSIVESKPVSKDKHFKIV